MSDRFFFFPGVRRALALTAAVGMAFSPTQSRAGVAAPLPPTPYNYYVASTGSDGNPGTREAPFRTIPRAARVSVPGTTIHVAPGLYEGGFKTTASGNASERIHYLSTIKWGARIVPPPNSPNHTAWDNRGSYTDIVGFEVDGSQPQGGMLWTHGIYHAGSFGVIRANRVHHIALHTPCTNAGGSAIGVDSYYGGMDAAVIGNLVHDIGAHACRFVQGIYVSTSATVKNNVVYRVSGAAIHLWHDARNVVITNNTLTTSGVGIIVGGGDFYYTTGPSNHVAVANNIAYDNTVGIAEQGHIGPDIHYANNLVCGNTGANFALKSKPVPKGTVCEAPQFVNYRRDATPDLRLTKRSPAIGRGTPTHAAPLDFQGRPRNGRAGIDIGAYQH